MNSNFKLAELSDKAIQLFNKAETLLKSSKNANVNNLARKVPKTFTDSGSQLSIVFAGQYSAGKSSILTLLTGLQQRIGEGVTTSKTKKIDWNGMTVIDTPGIHTQIHPDHDKITYDAIASADLIVFVLTNEGFGNHLGNHFRKLINEMGKGHEMMLVVNKMDREAMGNTPELHKIKSNDINKVLEPNFTVDDMYTSFISSDLYKESFDTCDKDDKEDWIRLSGWNSFLNNLNHFAKDKRFAGKYTTNLYKLEQIIQDALALYSTDNPEADASVELLNRNRRALVQCRQNIKERTSQQIQQGGSKVVGIGDSVALSLNSQCKESEFNNKLESAYNQTNQISNQILTEVEKIIGDETIKLAKAMEDVKNSQLAQDLKAAIQNELKKRNLNPNIYRKAQKGAQYAMEFGGWLDKIAKSPGAKSGWAEIFKLGNYSGSQAHKVVLEVGHFFGHKFKPWEAVKLAGKIGKAGKFLGVAGAFVGVAFQVWNDVKENEAEKNLLEARNDIRNGFRNAANVIEMEFDKQTNTWIEKEIAMEIKEIDSAISELEQLRKVESKEYENLKLLLIQVQKLIRDIQENA